MGKYYKVEDVIRKRAEDLADTSYWEYGNPKNVDEWLEVAEMEFKDLPTIDIVECEDCISREELPKVLNGVVLDDCDKIVDEFLEEHECDELWNAVRALRDFYEWTIDAPSVVPTTEQSSKVGEWHRVSADKYVQHAYHHYRCSECGEDTIGEPNYCPNCGADMRGEQDE